MKISLNCIIIVTVFLNLISCNDVEKDSDIHPFCASQSCSVKGKKELIETYEEDSNQKDTLVITVGIVVTTEKQPKYYHVTSKIKELNEVFAPALIKFQLSQKIYTHTSNHTIDEIESSFKIRNKVTEGLEKENIINLFIVPKGKFLNGFTYVVPDTFANYFNLKCNTIFINEVAWFNQSTLQHELGHFFGLQHTFGNNPKENTTKELANGTNCKTEGDFICDTPADPNGLIDKNCQFIGLSDKQKHNFTPFVNNYMSYYKNSCKNEFTNRQYIAMNQFANKYRMYLKVKQ